MMDDIINYLEEFDEPTKLRFNLLTDLLYESVTKNIQEKLWAKLPSFYINTNFVRIIPFKNHINISAKAIIDHQDELVEYKITPKGMLQIYHSQEIPSDILKLIYKESLE